MPNERRPMTRSTVGRVLLSLALATASMALALAASPPKTRGQPSAAKPHASGVTVRGKVTDESGKPVAGAEVWLPWGIFGVGRVHALHGESDSEGRFALEVPAAWISDPRPWDRWQTLWAHADGHQLGSGMARFPDGASDVTIRLGPPADTSFVVSDPDGRPCAGALVEPYYVRTATGGSRSWASRKASTP